MPPPRAHKSAVHMSAAHGRAVAHGQVAGHARVAAALLAAAFVQAVRRPPRAPLQPQGSFVEARSVSEPSPLDTKCERPKRGSHTETRRAGNRSDVLARAYIEGAQSVGLAAVVKHFILNNQESSRMTTNAEASDRVLFEVYYVPFVAAIEAGFPQREIQNAAYQAQLATDRREQEVVGVNVHTEGDSPPTDLLRVDPRIEQEQIARLQAIRSRRDAGAVRERLDALQQGAAGDDNLMPLIVDAVRASCSLGEVADSLRSVFGEYRESVVI